MYPALNQGAIHGAPTMNQLPILQKNRYALKEWAVVVEALSSGRQTLLLRKGGIMEDKGEFTAAVERTDSFR